MKNKSLISAFFMFSLIVLLVSTYKTEAFGQTTPKVAIVSLDHVPFVEGDNNEFYISAKDYTGQVQYQLFYIQESVMKEWKLINNVDMVNGWTKAIDAQTPIIVGISNLNLKADKYRFAIRVRRVGVQGLKQNSYGDYDDAYPFNLDVAKNANIKLSDNINMEKTNFSKNENLVINGVGNLSKDVQYKLHLFDVKNNKWLTDLTDYSTSVSYSLKSIPEGTYIVDLWAKNSQSKNKYDGWKLKVINVTNAPIEVIPTIKEVSEITFGSEYIVMNINKTKEILATIKPVDATNKNITLSSSDSNIVSIENGVLTAKALGKATITATSNNGKNTKVDVYVWNEEKQEGTSYLQETNNFKFHYVESDRRIVEEFAMELELNYDRLTQKYAGGKIPTVDVHFYPSVKELHAEMNRGRAIATVYNITTIGTAQGSTDTILMASPLSPDNIHPYNEMKEAIVHEFTHNVCSALYPKYFHTRWLSEAVAAYESKQFELARFNRFDYIRSGEFPRISELKDGKEYAMGYVLIDFIEKTWGDEGLLKLIKSDGNIPTTFNISVEEFERQWHQFIRDNYITKK